MDQMAESMISLSWVTVHVSAGLCVYVYVFESNMLLTAAVIMLVAVGELCFPQSDTHMAFLLK